MRRKQAGFTLVEIAIVLVIIGLLLGGIIQGQQLINSARVKNLAETNSGVQAAYYGFIDRYRQIPGDMTQAAAGTAIGVAITGGGNGNGRLDDPPGAFLESNSAWEHLSAAGFIQGTFAGGAGVPSFANNLAPVNAFNNPMLLGSSNDYLNVGVPVPVRLHMVIGRGIPVAILRELDVKVDDGVPTTGTLRAAVTAPVNFSLPAGTPLGGSDAAIQCVTPAVPPAGATYNTAGNSPDCNAVFLF
jgi:prepilin-type N-terminal cleavage/methylation domain-containing protein